MIKKLKMLLALGALTAVSTSPVLAEAVAPTLKISGNSIINSYVQSQKVRLNGKGNTGPHIAIDVSDLYFLISGMTANGISYGYKVNLQAFPGSSPTISQNYIEFSGVFGTFQVGAVVGPEDRMIQDGITIAAATGGPDGGFSGTFNVSEFVLRGNDIIGDTGYATKIAYYTPTIKGFRLGVAFTPNTNHMGDSKLNTSTNDGNTNLPGNRTFFPIKTVNPYGLRNFAVGLSYKAELGKWGITGTGAVVTDKSYISGSPAAGPRLQVKNTLAYQLGAVVDYTTAEGLIQIGLGYLNNGKSRLPKAANQSLAFIKAGATTLGNLNQGNAGTAWNGGAAFTSGAYKFSATYQRTDRKTDATQKTSLDVYSVGGEVTPVQGLKFFTEINYIRAKTNATAVALSRSLLDFDGKNGQATIGSNIGTVFVLGTKVSF